MVDASRLSNGIFWEGFGFAIPLDATIVSVTCSIKRKASVAEDIRDNYVRIGLIDWSGLIQEPNLGRSDWWPTEPTDQVYGGEDVVIATPLTPAVVNDESFGVTVQVAASEAAIAYVDCVSMTVIYEPMVVDEPMSIATELVEARAELVFWKAELKKASVEEYQVGSVRVVRRLKECRGMVSYWQNEVDRLTGGRQRGPRNVYIVPKG
jgi:hypothetical protein